MLLVMLKKLPLPITTSVTSIYPVNEKSLPIASKKSIIYTTTIVKVKQQPLLGKCCSISFSHP